MRRPISCSFRRGSTTASSSSTISLSGRRRPVRLFWRSCSCATKPVRGSDRLVAVSLGAIWVWVAWSFLWHRSAQINWAASYAAPVYALEGLLFIWVGCARGGLSFAPKRSPPSTAGLALLLVALLGYPLIAPALGRRWLAAETFAVVPDPTAATTLAILALSSATYRAVLMIIP